MMHTPKFADEKSGGRLSFLITLVGPLLAKASSRQSPSPYLWRHEGSILNRRFGDISGRPKFFLSTLILLVAAFLAYQWLSVYNARQAYKAQVLETSFSNNADKAIVLDGMINLWGKDLYALASSPEITGFFSYNRLGMSETYGLRASRRQIFRLFKQHNLEIDLQGRTPFKRLALFEKNGSPVTEYDTGLISFPASSTSAIQLFRNVPSNGYRVAIESENSELLLFTAPVHNGNSVIGFLAGWVSLPEIFSQLFRINANPETSTEPTEWVRLEIYGQQFVYPRHIEQPTTAHGLTRHSPQKPEPRPTPLSLSEQGTQGSWLTVEGQESSFYLFPAARDRFTLTYAATKERLFPFHSPETSSIPLAIISAVMLVLFLLAITCQVKADISQTRVDRATNEKRILQQHSQKLFMENSTRKYTESSLRRENAILRAERERNNLALAATNIGFWDWRLDRDEVTVNDRWAMMLGYEADELRPCSYRTWADLIHPDDRPKAFSLLDQHLRGANVAFSCELRMLRKNGGWLWVLTQGQVIEWAQVGKAKRMTGSHTDISVQKATEQHFKESEEKFRAFFESIDDMIFAITAQGHIVYANPAVETTLQYPIKELQGIHLLELHPENVREEAEKVFQAMLAGSLRTCPLPLLTRNGRTVPVETRVWRGKWNDQEVIFGISKDLSGEEEAKQKFERVFRYNPALMSLSALETDTLIDVNHSFLDTLGFSRQEVLGKTFNDLNLFTEPETATRLLRPDIEGHFSNIKMQVRHRDGRTVDGLFFGERLHSQGNAMLLLVMINITDLENAERQLRLANETMELRVKERTTQFEELHHRMLIQDKMASLGQLAAGVAHELNNPINFVANNFSALKGYFADLSKIVSALRDLDNGKDTPALISSDDENRLRFILDDIPDLFEESQRGFERIAKIIVTMREFSRTDLSSQFVPFDVNAGIEETLTIARNTYKYCAEVETQYGEIPEIRCVPDLLKQVFLNLIVNSAQAIEAEQRQENGVIRITTREENDDLLCTFEDDGPGIPEDIMHRVFDPFFTTKPPGKGTGLGLSLCCDIIVKTHQGDLRVSCPGSGKGASFTIRLPMHADTARSTNGPDKENMV
jgi:PAS domain S-box-containing protein